jgi:Ni/Co efflux regulator RcnB
MNRQLAAILLVGALAMPVWSQPLTAAQESPEGQRAKQDMKDAGHETKNAAKDAAHGTEEGTKKAYHSTKRHTKHAWNKTKSTVKGGAEGAKEGARQPQ